MRNLVHRLSSINSSPVGIPKECISIDLRLHSWFKYRQRRQYC